MQRIMHKCPITDINGTIAYRLDSASEIYDLVANCAHESGMGHIASDYIFENLLVEYGDRPTEFPCIAIVESNAEHRQMAFTYITKQMFEV